MNASTLVLIGIVLIPVISLFAFAGCSSFTAADSETIVTTPGPPLTVAPPAYPDVIGAEPGLVGYWRLSEPAGSGVAVDSSKAKPVAGAYSIGAAPGHNGVLRLGNDPVDLAAGFDGVQGRVTVPFDLLHNPPLAFTIEAWIRPPAAIAQGSHTVVASFEGGTTTRGFLLQVVKPTSGATVVRARVGDGSNTPATLDVPLGPPTTDGWWHLVVTYQRTGAGAALNSKLKLYLNGASPPNSELPSVASAKQIDYKPAQSPTPLLIGSQLTGAAAATNAFQGDIDEVALYNLELNSVLVKNHFDAASKT